MAEWESKQAKIVEIDDQSNTTRWSLDASAFPPGVVVEVHHTPSRIEEEGIYKVYLSIYNNQTDVAGNLVPVNDMRINVYLSPKSGDTVYLDKKNTYLDTMRAPYYFWDMDVTTRGSDEHVTRASFQSDLIAIPAGVWTSDDHEDVNLTMSLSLELNLEYN